MNILDFIKSDQNYFQDFISRSTYHSNGIEGNTLSYAETYAILWNDNSFQVNAEPREWYEATNHKYALSFVIDHIRSSDILTENIIKKIGVLINRNIKDIDGYRKVAVLINGAEHLPPAPEQISQAMMYFVYNYNNTKYENVFEKIATNHIQFEKIHPFEDGNGRTGRLLINYELIKSNLAPVVIPKEERTKYFNIIADNDVRELSNYIELLSTQELNRIATFQHELKEKSSKSHFNDKQNER